MLQFIRASLLIFFCLSTVWPQGTTSRLTGVVNDPSGAAVASATVRLTNQATQQTFTTITSGAGTYAFEAVQPGLYTVTVESAGFNTFSATGNQVGIGQPTTVNVTLQVGQVTNKIEVSGAAEVVQTSTSGNVGNLLVEQQIRDLPIVGTRGRNPLQLVDLQPGVVDTQSITGGGVHVFGSRDRAWNFTLDGIDNNESSTGGSNFAPIRTNPDSLAEFRVITSNPTAEYGRSSGAQVALITRSGGNDLHGTGFEFYRTPRLNANEWQNNFNGLAKPQFVQHVFGGDIGGPIIKNKTFFFVNVQGLTALNTNVTTRTVYTAQARQGILRYVNGGRNGAAGSSAPSVDANGNALPGLNVQSYNVAANDPARLGLDRTISAAVNAAPLPNRFDLGDGLNTAGYVFSAAQQERQHDIVFKIDQIINEHNTFYVRGAFGEQDTNCDAGNGGQPLFPGQPCLVNTTRNPKNYAFNWRWNPTPTITNEYVIGFNRFTFGFNQPLADLNGISLDGSSLGVPADPPVDVSSLTFGNTRTLSTVQIVDNLAWQLGAHALKFGTNLRFQYELDRRGSVGSSNATQQVDFEADFNPSNFNVPAGVNRSFDLPTFQSGINFLLGRIGTVYRGFSSPDLQSYQPGLFTYQTRYNESDLYVQDTWKVNRNLTVDLGLRLEMKFAPSAARGVMARPNQALVAGGSPTNTASWIQGSIYKSRLGNLGPSIGIAWDPFGTGKTSVRANYRLAYDRVNSFIFSSQVLNNIPGVTYNYNDTSYGQSGGRLAGLGVVAPPSVSPASLASPAPYSTSSVAVVDPNLKFPTTHEWSFSLQRQIASHTVIQADYIGRRAYHLEGAYNANQPNLFANGYLDALKTVQAGGQSALLNNLFSADSRIGSGQTASDMIRANYSSALAQNSVASILNSLGTRLQRGVPVTVLSGQSPFAVIPYPQFTGGVVVIDSNDFSTYNGLVLQVQRQFAGGVSGSFSYTFSKALDTRSQDPTFSTSVNRAGTAQAASSTPFDIYNRALNYAPADYDHTHVFQANGVYELPFGKGRRFLNSAPAFLERMIGGFEIAGFMNRYSGRPFTVFSGNFQFSPVVSTPANCNGCSRTGFGAPFDQAGVKYFFTTDQVAKFSTPGPGQFGNVGRNYFRGPRVFDMDMSLIKRTRITERFNLELRADATNLTNSPSFGLPTQSFVSSTFGRIRSSVESASRKIQLGAKVNF